MKTPKSPIIATLPWFPGFYNSVLDSFIESEMEREMEEYEGRPAKTWEEVNEYANYPAARLAISQAWVDAFASESGLAMEMESIQSPREYNFETDRVFVTLPPATLKKLQSVRKSPEFAAVLADWFTSRPGFIPFYSNDPADAEWKKPLKDWDHNQLSALIAAYVTVHGDGEDINETLYGQSRVYEAADAVWDALPPRSDAA